MARASAGGGGTSPPGKHPAQLGWDQGYFIWAMQLNALPSEVLSTICIWVPGLGTTEVFATY